MAKPFSILWKPLMISVGIALGAGALSALITGGGMEIYQTLRLPPLAPPGIVFPIVWTILYVFMGVSAYLVYQTPSENRKSALGVYALQLLVNILWSPIFFGLQAYRPAFFWLALLWVLVLVMITKFHAVDPAAAWLQVPYLLWVTFAGYLNFSIWVLN